MQQVYLILALLVLYILEDTRTWYKLCGHNNTPDTVNQGKAGVEPPINSRKYQDKLEKQCHHIKTSQDRTKGNNTRAYQKASSRAAAANVATSRIDRTYLLVIVGLVPCYLVYLISPTMPHPRKMMRPITQNKQRRLTIHPRRPGEDASDTTNKTGSSWTHETRQEGGSNPQNSTESKGSSHSNQLQQLEARIA